MPQLTLKQIIQKYEIKPSKKLGQNFLINKGILEKIVKTADLSKKDNVLEIGPGLGILTMELAKKAKKVLAVEKDLKMIEALKEILKDSKNIELLQGDGLKINLPKWKHYKLVANIPYYLTSPLIRHFLEAEHPPEEIVLLIQKEVAQRICAQKTGNKIKMSLLSVAVQFYATPQIIAYVSKNSFWPAPKVDSAIIKITPLKKNVSREFQQDFFRVVKVGFSNPRKQLANNLSNVFKIEKEKIKEILKQLNLNSETRAESLSVEEWKEIVTSIR